MKIKLLIKNLDKGQVLPIIVIAMIALIALAALMIDGGMLLSNRRTAQAAADAGALAGAFELCYSNKDPYDEAENIAMMNLPATPGSDAIAEPYNGRVKVTTSITYNSFFANIFELISGQNYEFLTASAYAVAGCVPPSGKHVMPIAWSCRPPVNNLTGSFSTEYACLMAELDWLQIKGLVPGVAGSTVIIDGTTYKIHTDGTSIVYTDDEGKVRPHPYIYLIMDSKQTGDQLLCKEDLKVDDPYYDSAIYCYTDGVKIISGGDRGWLTLDVNTNGVASAAQINNWIQYGYPGQVKEHSWLIGQPGEIGSSFQNMKTYRQGDVVWIPVYNHICIDEKNPCNNTECMKKAHENAPYYKDPYAGEYNDVCITKADSQVADKYHIIAFVPFYISCVKDKPAQECPGNTLAQELYPSDIAHNMKSVEGYFLINVDKDTNLYADCDVDLGNCIVSLVE